MSVSIRDLGKCPPSIPGHSSGATHVRQQRRFIIKRIFLVTWVPLGFCNKVAVVRDREYHITQLLQQL